MLSELVIFLLQKKAHREPVRFTTKGVSQALGVSQQTVSRNLISLEKAGLVQREGSKIMLTALAAKEAEEYANLILRSLAQEQKLIFHGKLVSGVGDGKYYLSLPDYKRAIKQQLGFVPFPGTLNLRLPAEEIDLRLQLRAKDAFIIPGFKHEGRNLGRLFSYTCRVGNIQAIVVFPEYSHHGLNTLEIMAPVCLRQKLKLKDGDALEVEVF